MLDKYSSRLLLSSRNVQWIGIILKKPYLTPSEKYSIAFFGNHEHRRKLLKDIPDLNFSTKLRIAMEGDNKNRAILWDFIIRKSDMSRHDKVILQMIRTYGDIVTINNILKEENELRRKKSV